MEPYRFSFETDEQYQGRVGDLGVPASSTEKTQSSTSKKTVTTEQLVPTLQTQIAAPVVQQTPRHSTTTMILPWWAVLALVLAALLAYYVAGRRKNEVHVHLRKKKLHPVVGTPASWAGMDDTMPVWKVTKISS